MKRVIFSGGGTGGHIYPALAIRETILEQIPGGIEARYLGQGDGMEARIVGRIDGLPFEPVRAQGMPRTASAAWLTFPGRNALGFADAFQAVRRFKPDLVVTTGGFVAFPVLAAARLLGYPYVIHEQNAAMGVTNRLFAGGAAKILLTYGEAWPGAGEDPSGRVVIVGNPVRKAFLQQGEVKSRFERKPGEFWLLAVGGSRGATSLNKACVELGKTWLTAHPHARLLHITGERDYESIKAQVSEAAAGQHIVLPYLHEMREAFAVADLMVSRSGATILAEIACCGKPAVLVPFPFATDNHQEKNARILERTGAAKVILDRDLTGESLGKLLDGLSDPATLSGMAEAMRKGRPADVESRIWKAVSPLLA